MRRVLIVLSVISLSACSDPAKAQLQATVRPAYDKGTGKLKELTYDANGNGRVDAWTEMDGTRPVRSRIDTDEDGKIDRWEHYGDDGKLVKVGFSRRNQGKADAWVFSGPDGRLDRIEISSTADERRIDRWEYYDPSRSGSDGRGALVRAEEDTTSDGRPDKWETYEQGAIKTVAFDENGNGRPDRRLTYAATGHLVIESEPDASGRFARRVEVK
jgi:hypothetical protein